MAGKISRRDIERLIFGEGGVRRFTQDSAVLPDVWIEYGENLNEKLDLLITPERATAPGKLALLLEDALEEEVKELTSLHASPPSSPTNFTPEPLPALFKNPDDAEIAYNQSTVAAKLCLEQLIRVVLPMTSWWNKYIWKDYGDGKKEWAGYGEGKKFYDLLLNDDFREWTIHVLKNPPVEDKVPPRSAPTSVPAVTPEFVWLVRVAGTLFFASRKWDEVPKQDENDKDNKKSGIFAVPFEKIYDAFVGLMTNLTEFKECTERQVIWTVSRNREATSLIFRSTLAVKADAARRVFELSCEKLRWAVLDSGIDATHPAFRKRHPKSGKPVKHDEPDEPGKHDEPEPGTLVKVDFEQPGVNWEKNTRVIATYDFSKIRTKLARMRKDAKEEERGSAPSSLDDAPAPEASQPPQAPLAAAPPAGTSLLAAPTAPEAKVAKPLTADEQRKLKRMRESLLLGYNLNWEELEPELRVKHDDTYKSPRHEHGTHVAGILAGDWHVTDEWKIDEKEDLVGVCPDLSLYDLRVLDDNGVGDEFSVIAALQFVRHLNAHNDYRVIHGVNMSLSIRHDVANYACGSTPVCEEAERLVNNGTVVVAAAGNKGYMQYITPEGRASEGYSSISITDPGNADGVLTVGSTHSLRPHEYGVSYFSSRGPTGDGRLKPDLVAPGEKITSAVPGSKAGRKDGTSMAAPHVSGAAALLMARHPELVGRPTRIKEILCRTATDLGRERYFQGNGMVDILRALQSV
ncbi:MAG TPA: S8 family peptidase [Pyrinomonadaceae bacterium]|jgi:subtilisin family serine protease|nr:S8 family peptidase [Pyrinomonadaceae bacterium]